jgi:hypothetical protein
MGDVSTLVSGIEFKVRKLSERNHFLKAEHEKSVKEILELKENLNQQKKTIEQLEEKINILKLAKAFETKEGNVEAKLKINELLREIEKCIGLLNT